MRLDFSLLFLEIIKCYLTFEYKGSIIRMTDMLF